MGYSCTMEADNSMRKIQETFSSKSNFWADNKGEGFFFELGRENRDGSITGTVFDDKGLRNGGIRIEPNGYITRWTHLSKKARTTARKINKMINLDRRNIDEKIDRDVDEYLKSKGINY